MWLMTPIGFFSTVQKPGVPFLTIRTRSSEDLDALRSRYLPELTPTQVGAGTDYPYRATCSHKAWAGALGAMARDITYPNFKSEIAARQGPARAEIYAKVWGKLHAIQDVAAPVPTTMPAMKLPPGKRASYGGVLIDDRRRVLLRRPKGDFDGAKWTFAKGRPNPGESPQTTALREVLEETGYTAEIVAWIPGDYTGTTTINRYWLMRPIEKVAEPQWETEDLCWCDPAEARERIATSPSATKRTRDRMVLDKALEVHRYLG